MIIIEFALDYPLFRRALSETPGMRLTWERTDAIGGDRTCSLLWAEGGDFEALEAALEADPTVETPSRVVPMGDRRLYQVEVRNDALDGTYPLLVELGCLIRHLSGTRDGWEARIAFPDQAAVDRFFGHCRTTDLDYRVHRVYEERGGEAANQFGLTDEQLETLRAAVELGYLNIPRERTLQDLGEHLGVSDTAASQRFRRGVKRLIEHTVYRASEAKPPPTRLPR